MAKNPQSVRSFNNTLLARLSALQIEKLEPHLQPVTFEVKQGIYEPGKPFRYAYFVERGMISVVNLMEDGKSIEVGTIGKEGMAGSELLLEVESSSSRYYVQIAGDGHRISAGLFKEVVAENEDLRRILLRYQAVFLTQTMQGAACNGLHNVQQRCCRWLLTARDRSESDELPLTHEFLALMLGVRRASVSEVLQPLQEKGWVRSNRGELTILNRRGLESGSCECYRKIANQYKRLLK